MYTDVYMYIHVYKRYENRCAAGHLKTFQAIIPAEPTAIVCISGDGKEIFTRFQDPIQQTPGEYTWKSAQNDL